MESLRRVGVRSKSDTGTRPGLTTSEREELKRLQIAPSTICARWPRGRHPGPGVGDHDPELL